MKKYSILMVLLVLLQTVFSAAAQDTPAAVQTASETQLQGQLSLEDLHTLNNGEEQIFLHNGAMTLLDGTAASEPVRSQEDAAFAALSMISLLGGDIRTELIPWRTFNDTEGNIYYVFQQISGGVTISGGAVKVITDKDGKMIGLSSSLVSDLPDVSESFGITAEEAEQIVLKKAEEQWQTPVRLIEGVTDKIILPLILSVDDEEHNETDNRYVWVVYTENPGLNAGLGADLPFLAHYVAMDGEYLYSLETIYPGDSAGTTGFDSIYIFEFMEPAEYTGYVDLSDGTEKEITVTLMRDKRTGMYYLGNIERKIVIADCYEFLYNHGNVRLEYSPDNLEWDQVGLLSLYNYCRAYDYYREIGWIGGDGKGTPIMVLNNFCDENHKPIDNAAFMGNYLGWSLFAASQANDFSQCLDVIAHEFTHCVTGSVMTYNSYQNDFGAINEGMSDIQGNICELMAGAQKNENTTWVLGDNSMTPVRSMDDPHSFSQPEYSWDFYYKPAVKIPTPLNDEGGVHTNSSLINNVAYRLIADGGMTYEEARAFWFAVDCTMVPGTDYAQLAEILPWVLKITHLKKYDAALQQAITATRLGDSTMPETLSEDRALVKMVLPDREDFSDGNWALQIYSANIEELIKRAKELGAQLEAKDYSQLPEAFVRKINEKAAKPTPEPVHKPFSLISDLLEILNAGDEAAATPEPTPEEPMFTPEEEEEIKAWIREKLADVFYGDMGAAGQDGLTVQMLSRPGRSIPILLHMAFNESSMEPDQVMMLVYIGGRWYELPADGIFGSAMGEGEETAPAPEIDSEAVKQMVQDVIAAGLSSKSLEEFADKMIVRIPAGGIAELQTTGLENVVLPEPSAKPADDQQGTDNTDPVTPGPKSRPKLPNE